MFSKIKTERFIQNYCGRIERAALAMAEADAVIIGAGAGLSAAAGLRYSGTEFEREFADYISRYGFPDLYTSAFYEFPTEEERWARWARHIDFIRFRPGAMPLYRELYEMVVDKEYFIITTNVDAQFRKAGFDCSRIFEVQGDYGQMQCAKGCHDTLYDDCMTVKTINANARDMTVDSRFVPRCPVCGGKMDVHVRVNGNFVEDKEWHNMMHRYYSFLDTNQKSNLVLLELGVGFNTPTIIRFPFEQITYENPSVTLIRINDAFPNSSPEIKRQAVLFSEDITTVLASLKYRSHNVCMS